MKKLLPAIASVLAAACAVCFILHARAGVHALLPVGITLGTIAYHLIMRLLVGWAFRLLLGGRADPSRPWFTVGEREKRLYERLRVKEWKHRLPTYRPEDFDPRLHGWSEIASTSCCSELVHETCAVLSLAPIVCTAFWGEAAVFIITSLLAAAVDLVFAAVQRYNRPRLMRLIAREKR
ncbi:MAG: hypothetical protein IKS43_02095 [Clostridia bacterium]|nr:hypothetical protein [Clostridia bacterium]